MRKLFKHLKPYAATIAAIVVILIVQAYCDLSLPSYTSDIVNVGIQQGGIDEKIPDAIAEEEMNKLLLFVAEEDQQTVLDAYEKKESDSDYKYDGAIYVLKDSVKKDEEKSGKVFDILGKPMLLTYGFESGSDTTKKMEESMKENMISSIKEQAEKQAESMTDKDFVDLLFKPSFSTADKITDVSGRGVGLDVVKTKIEALGGSIIAKTVAGEGSTFTIQLPLTLAIIQALMVQVGEEKYAIPLGNINGIEDIPKNEISFVQSKEVINLRGTVIPILRLHEILDIEESGEEAESLIVVVIKKGEQQVGLVIDDLLGQQETVIKSLGKHITYNKLFSGATILGDGEVALILDTNTLF